MDPSTRFFVDASFFNFSLGFISPCCFFLLFVVLFSAPSLESVQGEEVP